ncbi:MAG: UDP-2,3-diacylglucosamine diphosphatase [Gemmatimonadota bacterium]
MPPKPVYITSDIHLGAVSPEREEAFRLWLLHAAERASSIVINGDLFDFWFEYREAVPRGHTRVLGILADIVDSGTPVVLMGGNHDWWGGSFLREEIGLIFHQDPLVVPLAGRDVFIAHGDGLGKGDLGYRLLRLVLRGSLTRWGFRWLHPDIGARIAQRVSRTESYGEELTGEDRDRSAALEAWAIQKLIDEPELDMVLLGHSHIPAVVEVGPGRYYMNAGDWIRHKSFIVLEDGAEPRLEYWGEESAGSQELP